MLAACRPVQPAAAVTVTDARNAAVTSEWRGQTLLLEITSPTGIGSASITLGEGVVPRDIVVRLHLAGLEQITFAYAGATVQGSLSSVGEPAVRQEVLLPGAAAPEAIDEDSPYWLTIASLDEGGFDVRVPEDFLASGARAFALSWIDFYR